MAASYFLDFHVLSQSMHAIVRPCRRLQEDLAENTGDHEAMGGWSDPSSDMGWGLEISSQSLGVVWDSLSMSRVEGLCQGALPSPNQKAPAEGVLIAAIVYGPSLAQVQMVLADSTGRRERVSIPDSVLDEVLGKPLEEVWQEDDEDLIDKVGDLALPFLADESQVIQSLRAIQDGQRMDKVLPPPGPSKRLGRL